MSCQHCSGEIIKGLIIFRDGSEHVAERCTKCGGNPNKGRAFLPKSEGWIELPVIQNMLPDSEPCAVKGCTNKGTQLHHFFPKYLFEYADDAPAAYLCFFHHMQQWHKKLTPKMTSKTNDKHN
jgi:hypothetical protein